MQYGHVGKNVNLFAGESGENVMGVVGNLARPGCGYAYKVVRHAPRRQTGSHAYLCPVV